MTSLKKYSHWQKIDLHIHTDWSKKTKENDYKGKFSVKTLKSKLKENDVSVFSLTDHNIINIDAYTEYYNDYDSYEDPLLLVGVELDINVKIDEREKIYHSLLIFNFSDIDGAKSISDRLEEKYLEKGLAEKQRVLNIDEVVELFPEDDFFFIPHAGNTRSIVSSYRNNIEDAQKMVLLMQSAFEKVPQKARHIYNEGFDKVLEKKFRNKNDHAYIEFTDNHFIENYPCANKGEDENYHSFYYVKGGKNFETLRLAFIDPQSRIKSERELAKLHTTNNYLDKIKITDDGFLKDGEVSFSPHLNVLVGGRSSGKSLMMSLIGDKIDSIKTNRKKYENLNYDCALLKTTKDTNFKQTVSISNDDIIYLEQGSIVRYFEENKLSDLAKESDKFDEYLAAKEKFSEKRKSLETKVEVLINSYEKCLEQADKRYILHESDLDHILSENFVFICDLEQIKKTYDIAELIGESAANFQRLISDANYFLRNDLFELDEEQEKTITEFISLVKEKESLLTSMTDIHGKKMKFLDSIEQVISDVNGQLNIESQQKNQSLNDIKQLKQSIHKKFRLSRILKHNSYLVEEFDFTIEESITISENVNLNLEVGFVEEKNIKNSIGEGIHDFAFNESLYLNLLELSGQILSIKNYTDNSSENLDKKIQKELEIIYNALNNPRDYLSYGSGETSKNNSPGYNSEKYLEVLLKNPKSKIIFIDQPEDNLGNKFISERLVTLIRNIKFSKQLILVTHNPSIVVYGDAENIIIARNENNRISYSQVVLENQEYQKEICKILDGGEYIFDMRSKKYNINRLMKGGIN